MREVRCPDPCGRKPCVWWEGPPEELASLPRQARLVLSAWDQHLIARGHPCVIRTRVPLGLPAPVRVEVSHRDLASLLPWLESWGHPWTLGLESLVPEEDDDLAGFEVVVRQARAAGCDRVLASLVPATERPELRQQLLGDRAYRYRLYAVLRSLCDEWGLKFALLELGEVPDELRFNRFFGNARPCCRGFPG